MTPEAWAQVGAMPGVFSDVSASFVATVLFLGRASRPDISVALQRLRPRIPKWSTTRDLALIRLYSYLDCVPDVSSAAALGPNDLADLILQCWSDADWA